MDPIGSVVLTFFGLQTNKQIPRHAKNIHDKYYPGRFLTSHRNPLVNSGNQLNVHCCHSTFAERGKLFEK